MNKKEGPSDIRPLCLSTTLCTSSSFKTVKSINVRYVALGFPHVPGWDVKVERGVQTPADILADPGEYCDF